MRPWVLLVPVLWACGEVADRSVDDAHGDGLEADSASDATTPEADAASDATTLEADMSDGVTLDAEANADASADLMDGEPPEPIPLVDAAAWGPAPLAQDPFAAARPADATCAEGGLRAEAGTLEIDTRLCNWPTLTQPLLAPVAADASVEVIFWFGPALAPEAGEAVTELRFGDEVIWHKTFTVPNIGGFVIETVTPPRAFAQGEAALFHLHNHGANTWNLASVSLVGSL